MSNKILIGDREIGKTTYLFNEIKKLQDDNFIILDSATEHEDKSLLKMVVRDFSNSKIIFTQNINDVVLNNMDINTFVKNYYNYFPYKDIVSNINCNLCFDLSYFLEKGHDIFDETSDLQLYKYYRNIYNLLAEQIIISIILCKRYGIIKSNKVFMDEIVLPITNYKLENLQGNIDFIAAVHPENAFGTFYKSFDTLNFKSYKRERRKKQ